jgi:hypothetical protein
MSHTEPIMMESAPASMRNLDATEVLAAVIDSRCSDWLRVPIQGTARQRGLPRIANLAVLVGSHRRESVTFGEV